jgi:hypothetical protein
LPRVDGAIAHTQLQPERASIAIWLSILEIGHQNGPQIQDFDGGIDSGPRFEYHGSPLFCQQLQEDIKSSGSPAEAGIFSRSFYMNFQSSIPFLRLAKLNLDSYSAMPLLLSSIGRKFCL